MIINMNFDTESYNLQQVYQYITLIMMTNKSSTDKLVLKWKKGLKHIERFWKRGLFDESTRMNTNKTGWT